VVASFGCVGNFFFLVGPATLAVIAWVLFISFRACSTAR
jgi:hypothetical protein